MTDNAHTVGTTVAVESWTSLLVSFSGITFSSLFSCLVLLYLAQHVLRCVGTRSRPGSKATHASIPAFRHWRGLFWEPSWWSFPKICRYSLCDLCGGHQILTWGWLGMPQFLMQGDNDIYPAQVSFRRLLNLLYFSVSRPYFEGRILVVCLFWWL